MIIAFDLETDLIQKGLLAPPPVCGSFAIGNLEAVDDMRDTLSKIRAHLVDPKSHIVGANIAYDMAIIAAYYPETVPLIFKAYDAGRIHDVQIRQALDAIAGGHLYRDPRTGGPLTNPETGRRSERYSLAICASLTLNRAVAKKDTWRMRYARLRGVPVWEWPGDARQYSKDDARNTLDVFEAQARAEFQNLECEPDEVRAAFALHLMSVWGLRTDPARVAEVAGRVEKMHEETQVRFKAAGLIKPDGVKDTKAIADRVSAAYKGSPPLTDTGRIKADRDTLRQSGDELLEDYAEAGENEKLFSQYLEVIRQGTRVPINCSYNVLVDSGRTSCSRPNIQNLPRNGGIRECFVARPGFVFCSVDYSALELCTLAQAHINLFGRSAMADAINAGQDLHSTLAAQFIGVSLEDFKSRDDAKNLRQAAKAANFGFPGRMGPAKLVLAKRKEGLRFCTSTGRAEKCGVEMLTDWKGRECPPVCRACVEVADELRQAWFSRWPEMKAYFDLVSRETFGELGGTIVSFGNGMRRGGCGVTDGANHRFQNLAAQGAKRALWEVTRECYTDRKSPLWGSRPVAFIHDEIFSELVESRAHEAAERKTQIMVSAMRKYTPDVKISAEPALCRYWYKEAATARDAQGRLIPWELE